PLRANEGCHLNIRQARIEQGFNQPQLVGGRHLVRLILQTVARPDLYDFYPLRQIVEHDVSPCRSLEFMTPGAHRLIRTYSSTMSKSPSLTKSPLATFISLTVPD